MGLVLSFPSRSAASHSRSAVAGHAAAVIIFPGVRYERTPEPSASFGLPERASETAPGLPKPTSPKH